ncbi:MAG: nickel pincer cofactor biosynthesis protein LarB [Verrucomicrobiales bacterium]|jgi:NCAIR mutase (PurE)-related protein|nr:nickel pincer cofactor biosynthesis protein LarB [Verrucomicrobiales bacterium]
MNVEEILTGVKNGSLTVTEARDKIRYLPYEDLQYAMIDYHRELRTGCPEVVYGAGKTVGQVRGIVANMRKNGSENILLTRATPEMFEAVREIYPQARHHSIPRLIVVEEKPFPKNRGIILVATGGTSDMSVAEEAALTAEFLGNHVERLFDVGVAGLHRVLSHLDKIKQASVLIVVAGMEGALASVIGGLTDKPVIAVPTSVGYGANFGGLSALLSMLNSCASGVGVVNIDNGYGAGYLANSINKLNGIAA